MNFITTEIPDVILIEPRVFADERGFFMETWHKQKFLKGGIDADFVQDNHSRSVQGTLRGLHYQVKRQQGKLVRVILGEVYDVAVDIRRGSPTFGKWIGFYLSAENKRMLWIPPGFAHGFYVTSDVAEFVYKCTDFYAPKHERCIIWNDSNLGIQWPLINGMAPVLSAKDAKGIRLEEAELP